MPLQKGIKAKHKLQSIYIPNKHISQNCNLCIPKFYFHPFFWFTFPGATALHRKNLPLRSAEGVVKSYNDRRGFGFLACTETADRFGRDVYMPKAAEGLLALAVVRKLLLGENN